MITSYRLCFFFFQAEDGIRDKLVTGVQTCALPIYALRDPVGGAEPIELLSGLLDVGNGERDVRQRGILPGTLCELRLAVDAHEVDLRPAADVHPVARDRRDGRAPRIVREAEHVRVELHRLVGILLRRADADAVMVELEHLDGHGILLPDVALDHRRRMPWPSRCSSSTI